MNKLVLIMIVTLATLGLSGCCKSCKRTAINLVADSKQRDIEYGEVLHKLNKQKELNGILDDMIKDLDEDNKQLVLDIGQVLRECEDDCLDDEDFTEEELEIMEGW